MKLLAALIIGVLLVLFQNCGGSFANSGNGNGYGGFSVPDPQPSIGDSLPVETAPPIVTYNEQTDLICADSSAPHAQIRQEGSVYKLVRENCAELASPLLLPSTDVQVEGSRLHYNQRLFVRAP